MRNDITALAFLGFLAGGLILTAVPATAEEPAAATTTDAPPAAVFEEEVFATAERPDIPTSNTVATKLPLSLQRTPASVSVVTGELFFEQDALVLGDALRNVAGVNVQTGNGTFDFFVVRGLDSVSSSLILTDGAPEPEASFYQLYNVERAEVLRGPSAFVYGGGPLGGAINLVRKQPEGEDAFRVGTRFGSFGALGGTVDANLASADGGLRFRVNGQWREADGYRDGRESDVLGLYPVVSWHPSEDTTWTASYERLDLDHAPDSGLPLLFFATPEPQLLDVPRTRSYQSPLDRSEQGIDRAQVDYESRLSERLLVRNKTYFRAFDWVSRATTVNGAFPTPVGGLVVDRSLLALDDEQEFLGNQAEALWFSTGDVVRHHLLAGIEIERLTDRFSFDAFFLPPLDPFAPIEPFPLSEGTLPAVPGQSLGADAESLVIAPYLVDQIAIGDRWQVLVGARFDRLDFDDELSGTDRTDEELSPMLGLVYAPSATLTLYANGSEAFAPPSTFAIAPDRVPEESRQVEAGVKKSFAQGRAHAAFAVYDLERENIAIPDATGFLRQTGTQEARGFEAEVQAAFAGDLDLTASYAYTDAELTEFTEVVVFGDFFQFFDRAGATPAFTPEHLANVWVSKRFGRGFGAGLGGRFVSEQLIDEDNVFEVDGYATFQLGAWWNRGDWRLSLHLDNLTDEEYLTRGFGAGSVIPAAGFAAYGGIDYRF